MQEAQVGRCGEVRFLLLLGKLNCIRGVMAFLTLCGWLEAQSWEQLAMLARDQNVPSSLQLPRDQ